VKAVRPHSTGTRAWLGKLALTGAFIVSSAIYSGMAQEVLDLTAPVPAHATDVKASDALLRLGDYYSEGIQVAPDFKQALGYYKQAANLGRNGGKLRVAEMLIEGQGTEQDVQGGLALLEDLADQNYPAALMVLARLHLPDRESAVAANPQKALGYLRRAADTNDPAALVALGDALRTGVGGTVDAVAALSTYEKAAAFGETEAFLRLGDFMSEGAAAAVDLERAFQYYQSAAKQGSATGQLRVAEMLARGHGVTRDTQAGLSLIQDLADEGSASAMLKLGHLLLGGDVGPISASRAVELLDGAALLGRADASLRLGELFLEGVAIRADRSRAVAYLEKAAAEGNSYALYVLGRAYTEGRLGAGDAVSKGLALLEEALAQGEDAAIVGLANTHLYGYGRSRNVDAAIALLENAWEAGNIAAGEQLVAMYRDGRKDRAVALIRPSQEQARAWLNRIAQELDREDLLIHSLLMDAAFSPTRVSDAQVNELSPSGQESLIRSLVTVAPNVYVRLVQGQLARLGMYAGADSGLLDRPTIRAILQYCELKLVREECSVGPLTTRSARVLSYAFHHNG
jgi:TPR repeat protein